MTDTHDNMTDTHDNNNATPPRHSRHWTESEEAQLLLAEMSTRGEQWSEASRWDHIANVLMGDQRSVKAYKARYKNTISRRSEEERAAMLARFHEGTEQHAPEPPRRSIIWTPEEEAQVLIAEMSTRGTWRTEALRWRHVAVFYMDGRRTGTAYKARYEKLRRRLSAEEREAMMRQYTENFEEAMPLEVDNSAYNFVADRAKASMIDEVAQEESQQCAVCLEMCTNVRFKCGHGLCVECFDRMPVKCTEGKWHKTCHMCRAPVFEKELAYSAPAE